MDSIVLNINSLNFQEDKLNMLKKKIDKKLTKSNKDIDMLNAFLKIKNNTKQLVFAMDAITVSAGYSTIESFKNIVSAIVPGVCRVQLGHIWHYFAHYDEATLNAVIKTAKVLEGTKTKNKL